MRHPGDVGDLFSSLSDAEDFGDLAFIGHYDGEAGLAEGFAELAEAGFSAWQNLEWANDRLLLPIIYNYRHALELALKQAIRQALECCLLNGDDPGLTSEALERYFKQKQRHRLGPLARQLAGMLDVLDLAQLPQETSRVLQDVHQLDPTGEAFRYDGHLKTSAGYVDVPKLVQRFRRAFGIIHGGMLTALHEHALFLHEIRTEYGA